MTELKIKAYADSSVVNMTKLSSQVGYIIQLLDEQRSHVLHDSIRKKERLVRSVLAGEVYAFAAAFAQAF